MNPYTQPQQYQQAMNPQLMTQLTQWFNYVDRDRSGRVDTKELQGALKQAGLNFSLMSCNMLLRLFDSDRTGQVSFQGFCNLYQWVQSKQQSFLQFDRDRSGGLDISEVYQALTSAGFNLDQHSFYAAIKAYDPDQNGTMSATEYVGLCAFLQIATNTFQSFDTQHMGSVNMNLNQFIYAAAQCK
ncbi:Penta-EF hand domain-containing protein 1 [Diplonema papillatum]|nr:Penta-EF hand domain-containing protein 1 [Diplonema papillatum]KAJ9453341.1 Penta-EF hand domain-containing protein 1 [Diplonema papillatum]